MKCKHYNLEAGAFTDNYRCKDCDVWISREQLSEMRKQDKSKMSKVKIIEILQRVCSEYLNCEDCDIDCTLINEQADLLVSNGYIMDSEVKYV